MADEAVNKPTPKEAAAIAADVYKKVGGKLPGGWVRSSAKSGIKYNDDKTGLQSGLYQRPKADGSIEYVYATAGTNDAQDAKQDATQLVGQSTQLQQSVGIATTLNTDLRNSELTFVGHSLGGADATADAMATGRDAITFNAAGLSSATISNLKLNQGANIDTYRVNGEIVGAAQGLIGIQSQGTMHMLGGGLGNSFMGQVMSTATELTKPMPIQFMDAVRGIMLHSIDTVNKLMGN